MLQPTPKGSNDRLPPESLPLVVGAVDEGASYAAYRSHNALFDYRVQHHHDRPFLCDFTYLDHGTIQEYTFGETSRLVSGFAKAHAARLGPRRRGEPSKVVGMLGRSGIDYMLNDLALIRL